MGKPMRVRVSPSAQMYKVYILQSLKDLKTYTGYTQDINLRLKEHNSGKVKATFRRRPLKVLHIENVDNLEEAKRKKKYWKTGGGRRRLAKYFKSGFPPIKI